MVLQLKKISAALALGVLASGLAISASSFTPSGSNSEIGIDSDTSGGKEKAMTGVCPDGTKITVCGEGSESCKAVGTCP